MISQNAVGVNFQRHVVVAVDLSDQSMKALCCAAREVYKPGDCVHLVHVSRVLQPKMTIQHNYPGATYDIPNLKEIDEVQHAKDVLEVIKSRFTCILDHLSVPYVVHIYLETDNAPASAVCSVLFKIAAECKATLIVLAAHNKAYGWNQFLLGSVAEHCLKYSEAPIMLVRDYQVEDSVPQFSTAPLVIPWAHKDAHKYDDSQPHPQDAAGPGGSGPQQATQSGTQPPAQ